MNNESNRRIRFLAAALDHKAVRGITETVPTNDIEIVPDSVCVHGDSKHALEFVRKIRSALLAEGICIEAIGSTEES